MFKFFLFYIVLFLFLTFLYFVDSKYTGSPPLKVYLSRQPTAGLQK
ncbi:hypothetical protein MHK_003701 [Candidatus Magnetomorum sp. HK-1]|nr:hypothetical protein MHK_003701 [Candidatus Magnetomorum sp. HK-1]